MAKVEMVIKLTRVYEPNPEDYPPGLSVQDMVEIDLEQIKEDPALLAELIAMGMFTVEATAKIIEPNLCRSRRGR